MYQQVKKLKEIGHTITSIATLTGLDYKTVKKYLKMSREEYQSYFASFKHKVKCFDPYRDEIVKIYQNANSSKVQASAIYDHLEEIYGDLPASERSFRNYMAHLRSNGELQLEPGRIFEPVEPLPPGQQMQLDFGEYRLKDNRKYYILAAILSHSRCRYVKIYDRPLTTKILIEGLNDCFAYYGGIPKEIVIDQDHLMVVRENKGDILLTNDFKTFRDEMDFDLYVCRKSDPQSKGKVENLVNFVKRSFFATRSFVDLEDARNRLSRWLARKANGKKCAPTGRKPIEHLEEERKFLNPLKNSIFSIEDKNHRELRKLDKLGQISVRGVKLLLPPECREKEVSVFISSEEVHVFDIKTNEKIAIYTLKTGISKTHIVRQKSLRMRKISEMKDQLQGRFRFQEWNQFVDGNYQRFRRYFTDQYNDFQKKFPQPCEELLAEAVKYCLINKTFSMSQLYDTYKYLQQGNSFAPEPMPTEYKLVNNKHFQPVKVAKGKIESYKNLVPDSVTPEVAL
jgi:transposase